MIDKYTEIETAVINKLSPLQSSDFEVVALPEVNAGYRTPPNNKAKVYVSLHSSTFDENLGTDHSSQFEDVNIAINIQSKLLRGATGIYNIASVVRTYLLGFKPLGMWPMLGVKSGFDDSRDQNEMWNYYVIFKTRYRAIIDFEPEILAPSLDQITYDNTLVGDSYNVPRH
jgi:hypothetical protein